jgi:hypothetical protein
LLPSNPLVKTAPKAWPSLFDLAIVNHSLMIQAQRASTRVTRRSRF